MIAQLALAVTTTGLLVRASRNSKRRLASMTHRAESAEQTVRRDEERMHQLRGAVAGISSATRILTARGPEIPPLQRRNLVGMLDSELNRLEHMLNRAAAEPSGIVALDNIITKFVLSYRHQGLSIDWQPSGASAWGRKEDIAEVMQVLLGNALRHAPGSTVKVSSELVGVRTELRVGDDGPGVPATVRDRIFERGVRCRDSVGEGLGLYVAHRLLTNHGGTLALADNDTSGAGFVVSLPANESA